MLTRYAARSIYTLPSAQLLLLQRPLHSLPAVYQCMCSEFVVVPLHGLSNLVVHVSLQLSSTERRQLAHQFRHRVVQEEHRHYNALLQYEESWNQRRRSWHHFEDSDDNASCDDASSCISNAQLLPPDLQRSASTVGRPLQCMQAISTGAKHAASLVVPEQDSGWHPDSKDVCSSMTASDERQTKIAVDPDRAVSLTAWLAHSNPAPPHQGRPLEEPLLSPHEAAAAAALLDTGASSVTSDNVQDFRWLSPFAEEQGAADKASGSMSLSQPSATEQMLPVESIQTFCALSRSSSGSRKSFTLAPNTPPAAAGMTLAPRPICTQERVGSTDTDDSELTSDSCTLLAEPLEDWKAVIIDNALVNSCSRDDAVIRAKASTPASLAPAAEQSAHTSVSSC